MKFKRIELYGFKSFADKHEIPFGNGITAIVGPNGCGKSNVADAIRWVLGEQSAKLLRGSSMQDVIFNGTEKRKSMSYCEVALVFDNREKLFPGLEYDEVVISRKLYRSGESEYLLNRVSCRLKDITDILRDANMGREGYSIIGQGRIDELLSSKPEDRRQIFEEAAGISKFKARKLDAERKLGRTRDNLTRIIDILEEKGKQLEPLRKQAETAKKWLEMRDTLRFHEVNTYIHQYDTAAEAKALISERLNGIIEGIELKQKAHDGATASYNEAMYELQSIDKRINALHEEQLALEVGMTKEAGDIDVLNVRLTTFLDAVKRLNEENDELKTRSNEARVKIEELKAEREIKMRELEAARARVDEFRNEYQTVLDRLTKGETDAETNKRSLMEAMEKLADIKANMSRLLAERDALAESITSVEANLAEVNEKLGCDGAKLSEARASIESNAKLKTELSDALKRAYVKNNELNATASELTAKIDKLSERLHTATARRTMLREMKKTYEGFAYSIRNLMNDARKDAELAGKIEGLVGQIISMDAKFETAIETALGNAMQNVVTRTEDDAKYIIAYLKKMKYGRVTFLPMTSIKPRNIEQRHMGALGISGCFGVASDLVRYDSKFDGIVRGLLGGTVVVDTLDTAVSLARRTGYAFKIVTLDGDVINPSGSITGGSKKNDIANIFSHERELKELDGVVATVTTELDDLNKRKEKCATELETVQEQIKDFQRRVHELDVDIAAKTEAESALSIDVEGYEKRIAELNDGLTRAKARVDEINADIDGVSELEALITSKRQSVAVDDETAKKASEELKAERDSLQDKMTAARVAETEAENAVKNVDGEVERFTADVAANAEKLAENEALVKENESQIETIRKSMSSDERRDREKDERRLKEVREKLAGLDSYKVELNETVQTVDRNRIDLMNELQALKESKSREEMKLLKVDTDIEQMEQRIAEEYGLGYAECLEFKEEGYDAENGIKEAARLKRAMSALGNVNVDAIESSKVIAAEYDEMNAQKEDLEKAEADLLKIIKELSDEMLEKFSGQFEQIRLNFIKIFKELFNGGNADLELLDNENPLEAGIEIKAQPPEKKLQSISLLSGGEKALTAIAILFAILKLKPMPFCLLDEIEAALDDANANRFAKYLRRFSENTQFIVITHRKPTMELADNLYGVTMEEKGVSRIVSVKLEDAVSVAEKA